MQLTKLSGNSAILLGPTYIKSHMTNIFWAGKNDYTNTQASLFL